MDIKVLSPLWGHEHLDYKEFLEKVRTADYDGFDLWIPHCPTEKKLLFDFLQKHEMFIVTQQHSAAGDTFESFRDSYVKKLYECAEPGPLLINSHTGRDYFSLEQHLELLDAAQEFTEKTGITVAHETHRGRLGYSPQQMEQIFKLRDGIKITADFSHWTCVTESMLENFTDTVTEAISRTRHVHARAGYEQGPQVADPRAPEWDYALQHFLQWWDRIVDCNAQIGSKQLTFTTEFGPAPYMPQIPFTCKAVANQFEINCFMKDLLKHRYKKINFSSF
ncbi:sugar phosphate isomerase/epimerase [Olivibacter sp. SDN3]|uniref:sugar phosphate isomerase/epimerase family protein n=1 Tax=Olivibacter sp. SDN3 TaxID=2764720 RepID=UPI0016511E1D|nr:sugar phosphate isomerase/epimerase [Olivibacter sp. SDN3]QNL48203.1 sugar phosphate isomerase/epimerase [Olivibacter sp. SDN3]